eukprot:Sdes_comp8789_c0_seq1m168
MTVLEKIRGKPKSGRVWKKVQKEKFSKRLNRRLKNVKKTWQEKQQEKNDRTAVKIEEKEMKDEKKREAEERKNRREEQKKRRLENQKKAEIVQHITNSSKIKKMSRKQLRSISTR